MNRIIVSTLEVVLLSDNFDFRFGIWFTIKMASGSSGAYIPDGVNMSKARVKRRNNDWSWDDEMLMYDVTKNETMKKKRLTEKEVLYVILLFTK